MLRENSGSLELFGMGFRAMSRSKAATASALSALVIASVILPWVSPLFLLVGTALVWNRRKFLRSWPMAVPMDAGIGDRLCLSPATGKPMPGKGVAILGHDQHGRECWMSKDDLLQHMLILGCTGSGKTEFMLGLCANALSAGSGFIYMDTRGDVSIFAKVSEMCASMGRSSDLLVLNFMTGNTENTVLSNTMNPFASNSASTLINITVSLMPKVGGDGAMWKGRAVAMFTGVIKALVWLRDKGDLDLNVGTIREFMSLKNIILLANDKDYPELPKDIRTSVRAYLTSLPGYVESKGIQQAQTTLDQHGYLEMQFSQIFGSLNDVYGHIFKSAYGQIDMEDVISRKKILLIIMPGLEKSSDEISNLGKIIVSLLKDAMSRTLSSNLEGNWEDVVTPVSRAMSPSPFLCVFDDCGSYMVDGMAMMSAMARSFGFAMVYASQDIPSLMRNDEKEAASIIANTNTKVFMRTEDSYQTQELANRSTGYAQINDSKYAENPDRIYFKDLKSQGTGEMIISYKGEVIQARALYVGATSSNKRKEMRLNLKLRPNTFIPLLNNAPPSDMQEKE